MGIWKREFVKTFEDPRMLEYACYFANVKIMSFIKNLESAVLHGIDKLDQMFQGRLMF
jgi:hypothetical protein